MRLQFFRIAEKRGANGDADAFGFTSPIIRYKSWLEAGRDLIDDRLTLLVGALVQVPSDLVERFLREATESALAPL